MLNDIVANDLLLLICGAAASKASAAQDAYYAGPGNHFWSILYETGLTPRPLLPDECAQLPRYRIGLTDMVKGQAGNDDEIDFGQAGRERLLGLISEFLPHILCFNGKRAAQAFFLKQEIEYGLQDERILRTRFFVAPSTSAAAKRWWKAELWHEVAQLAKRQEQDLGR